MELWIILFTQNSTVPEGKKDFKYFRIFMNIRLYFHIYKLANQEFQDYIPCHFYIVFIEATPLKQVFSGFLDFPVVSISF